MIKLNELRYLFNAIEDGHRITRKVIRNMIIFPTFLKYRQSYDENLVRLPETEFI
jgi:hypothetical protein